MAYNPKIHHRRSVRLQGYNYAQDGLYFITICCNNRKCHFGTIENNEMVLSLYGKIAFNEWLNLSERFSNFELDVFQIMPNHMHGIIVLNGSRGETINGGKIEICGDGVNMASTRTGFAIGAGTEIGADALPDSRAGARAGARASPAPTGGASIDAILGGYKSLVSNQILEIFKSNNQTMGKFWQRGYHDHIIRNERAYNNISNYIIHNPENWKNDTFHP